MNTFFFQRQQTRLAHSGNWKGCVQHENIVSCDEMSGSAGSGYRSNRLKIISHKNQGF